MKKSTLLLFAVFWGLVVYAQETVYFLPEDPVTVDVPITYINQKKLKDFPHIHQSDPDLEEVEVKYLLGYNSTFLYIYIEAGADEIIHRDRGYQNGDGFHLTIGRAHDNHADTDEFHVFGFSPAKDWTNKMRWYYNVDLSMERLGDDVQFESFVQDDKAIFELRLPWSVASPYHPWLRDDIGFNLCFVKAVNEDDKIYYFIKTDKRMQSEQSKRKYVNLHFEAPNEEGKLFAAPARQNIYSGQNLKMRFTGYFKQTTQQTVNIQLSDEENKEIHSETLDLKFAEGLSEVSVSLSVSELESGNYQIEVFGNKEELLTAHTVSVFEEIDFSKMQTSLETHYGNMRTGTHNTLQFHINKLETEINQLKPYQSSETIPNQIRLINSYIHEIEMQNDPLQDLRGTHRRAFLSEIDETYRPYSIYLPENYSTDKQYPLLVYLHGSGEDDQSLFRANFIREEFIVLAPNGRGKSNAFATEEAQIDIREAIEDVIDNFSINTESIILSGFSMGGYGVYMTFYQHPELFSALAILSGHPDLARKWGNEDGVNFLDEDLLQLFSDIPVYVYHGKQDLNCPFYLTEELVRILRQYNNNVMFRVDENAGHGSMSQFLQEDYHNWLLKHR